MVKKTVVLCFIHGFRVCISSRVVRRTSIDQLPQGGNLTFGDGGRYTEHLRQLVSQKLPKVNVKVLIYPKFETRGDLGGCVSRFRSW